jgi:hypothetical protein
MRRGDGEITADAMAQPAVYNRGEESREYPAL